MEFGNDDLGVDALVTLDNGPGHDLVTIGHALVTLDNGLGHDLDW